MGLAVPVLLLIRVMVFGALVVKLLTTCPTPAFCPPLARLWLKLPLLLPPPLLILDALLGLALTGLARFRFNFGTLVDSYLGFYLAESPGAAAGEGLGLNRF